MKRRFSSHPHATTHTRKAERRMVAKLAITIIAIGAAFGALLVNRQQRIDAVAEISRSQLRMTLHDKTISRLQAAVAESIRPDNLKALAFAQPWQWQQIPYRFDPFERRPSQYAAADIAPPTERVAPAKGGKKLTKTSGKPARKPITARTASATQERSR